MLETKSLVSCSLLLAITAAVALPAEAKTKKQAIFAESSIELPINPSHEVMTADLLASEGKELFTFAVDEKQQYWLFIYGLDAEQSKYALSGKYPLPENVYSFDYTESSSGEQHLYFLSANQLIKFEVNEKDKLASAFKPIHDVQSVALPHQQQYLIKGNFLKDVNNDGREDILLTDFASTKLLLANDNGTFAQSILPIKPNVRVNRQSTTYEYPEIHAADVNLDSMQDVVVVEQGKLAVYKQTEDGSFSSTADIHDLREDISGIDWWSQRPIDGKPIDQSNLVYRRLEQLKDINNDGITDMVVRYTQSSGVLDRANDYEIYLGQNDNGQLVYSSEPSSVISAEGTLTDLEFVDVDGDKKLEVMLAGFDIGLSQIIGALMSGSIDQDVHIFKMDESSNFHRKNKTTKEVELTFSLSSGTSGSPVVKLADIDGDGIKDLVLSDGDDALKIYKGSDKGIKQLFAKRAQKHKIDLPKEGESIVVEDLNGDGKDDLLIKYSTQDEDEYHKKIRVLFAI